MSPSKSVLWANALVRSEKINEFYCSVCTEDTSFAAWQEHILKATHIESLEKFNSTFERQGTNVRCKLCDKDFESTEIKTHGKLHSNCGDNYQRFFENHIVEWKLHFFCCLCNVVFLDYAATITHIDESTHKNLIEKAAESIEFSASIPPGETYKSLVTEGFIRDDKTRLKCKFCRIDIAFNKTKEHTQGFCHTYFKFSFEPKANEKKIETHSKVVSQNLQATESTESPNETLPFCYFEPYNETFFLCKICDCFVKISKENTKLHLETKIHMDSLQEYGCDYISLKENNIYYCECCKLSIPDQKMLLLHIKEESHRASMLLLNKQKLQSNKIETAKSVVVSTSVPVNYIVRLNAIDFYCKVCDMKLSDAKIIEKHSSESSHAASLSKYGCDGISMRGFNDYHCKYCDCRIPGRDNVFLHIKGRRHSCSVIISKRDQLDEKIKKNTEEEKPERPEWSKALSSMINELTKLSEQLNPKTKSKNPRPNRHFANQPIEVVSEPTPCSFCSLIVTSGTDLHCHMAGHFTMDFIHSRVDKNCNYRKNPYSGKAEAEQKKIAESFESLPIKLGAIEDTKVFYNTENNNLPSYQTNNGINDISTISKSSSIISKNKVSIKIETIKDSEVVEINENNLTIDQNSSDSNTNDLSMISKSSSIISGDYGPVKIGAIKDTDVFSNTDKNDVTSEQKSSDSYTNDNSTLSKFSSLTSYNSNHSEDDYSNSSESPQKVGQQKKTIMQKIVKLLDFDKDYIYDMKEKMREIDLGMKFCMVIDAQRIYCLVCRRDVANTLQNYFEHLCSLDHSEYLEGMEKDHALFEVVSGQFSELDLAYQYMEEASEDILQCLVCDEEVANDDYAIQDHIEDEDHEMLRDEMHINAKKNFEDIRSKMQCDWYNVHKYWCVPCSANFESDVNFVKHLESKKHWIVTNKWENIEKTMMYDFCAPCALLWYGYRCTYSYHCDVPTHKWLLRDGHYSTPGLPELAKNLLAYPDKFVDDTVNYLDSIAAKEREKERGLIEDLQNAVKAKFFGAKAYIYGSRASGLGSPDSDIDVFLDCGNRYNGTVKSENLFNLMKDVQKCLIEDSQSWDANELLTECRSPVIRANHRATGLSCDISVENGLSVENTKLVKSFNDIFPLCRKMILFLKQWLVFCNLSGSERISSYGLCWYVIFYLQKESILPSIAALIAMNKKSHIIAGWEVGVTNEFNCNGILSNYSLKQLLIRFFKFYANFDFRYDVACPLLGEVIKKRDFMDHHLLPKEMAPYIAYIEKSTDPEPLRVDSSMCIQDPFDLQHNITKAVSKVFLSRFRTCCSKSLDLLCS